MSFSAIDERQKKGKGKRGERIGAIQQSPFHAAHHKRGKRGVENERAYSSTSLSPHAGGKRKEGIYSSPKEKGKIKEPFPSIFTLKEEGEGGREGGETR